MLDTKEERIKELLEQMHKEIDATFKEDEERRKKMPKEVVFYTVANDGKRNEIMKKYRRKAYEIQKEYANKE